MDNLLPWAASLPLIPKLVLSALVVGFAIFVLIVLWTGPRHPAGETTSREPPAQSAVTLHGPLQGPVVISQNQIGGQVAQSITNIGPPSRQLSEAAIRQLSQSLQGRPTQMYEIEVVEGDSEARNLAFQIQSALDAAGWTCSAFANSLFPQPVLGLTISAPRRAIVVELLDWAGRAGLAPQFAELRDLKQVHILVGTLT